MIPDPQVQPTPRRRLPPWLKRPALTGPRAEHVTAVLADLGLATVCDGAACPNRGECFAQGTATFMIMGDHCTRNCLFCAVPHGNPTPLDPDEPARLATAVLKLKLKHVVITSVTRDDLPDAGAAHFAATINAVRTAAPDAAIEVLTPDFAADTACLDVVHAAAPDVFNHNVETTRTLTAQIRSGADYDRSLAVLNHIATRLTHPVIKSGIMLGLGESIPDVHQTLTDLRHAGVEMLTIGQYLAPSKAHYPVQKFYHPNEFNQLRLAGLALGFTHVAAGPFVRSSYHAHDTHRATIAHTPLTRPRP